LTGGDRGSPWSALNGPVWDHSLPSTFWEILERQLQGRRLAVEVTAALNA
jgi:hypothetical protein